MGVPGIELVEIEILQLGLLVLADVEEGVGFLEIPGLPGLDGTPGGQDENRRRHPQKRQRTHPAGGGLAEAATRHPRASDERPRKPEDKTMETEDWHGRNRPPQKARRMRVDRGTDLLWNCSSVPLDTRRFPE